MNKKVYLLATVILLLGFLPSTSAKTIYSTSFEDGMAGQDYNNDWISTTALVYETGGYAHCVDSTSHNGSLCFGTKVPDSGHGWVEWIFDYNLGDDEYVKKWEAYIKFNDLFYRNSLTWDFYDEYGLIFLKIGNGNPTKSDLELICNTNNSFLDIDKQVIGNAMKEKWVKFGYETLSNNTIRYFIGESSRYAAPFNIVSTKFPKLSRINFFNTNQGSKYFYIDDITIYTNHKPTADLDGAYFGYVKKDVDFNGAKSSDLDGEVSTYIWDFGDGANGSGKNVSHSYSLTGTYEVTLTVADNEGDTDTKTSTVIIIEPTSEGKSTPGFEITLVIIVLSLMIILKLKKRK